MVARNIEGTRLSDDLTNVLSSVEIPIVILGRDSSVRRFTATAARLFRLGGSHIGRTFEAASPLAASLGFGRLIADTLEHHEALVRVVQDDSGHWYKVDVRPYLTVDSRIDGAVVTAFDIDDIKRGERLIDEARAFAENIVDTVTTGLVVLDRDLRVRSANRAFHEQFGTSPAEVDGKTFFEVGQGDWDLPELRQRLEVFAKTSTFERLRVERTYRRAGRRVLMLDARHIDSSPDILFALEDITERERAQTELEERERGLRDMLMSAADAVLMTDAHGFIVFANHAAAKCFGYTVEELTQENLSALVPDRYTARPMPSSWPPLHRVRWRTIEC